MIATVRNAMKVLLLGPVEFRVDGAPVSLGRRRERLIFGALALHAGRVVSISRIATVAWDGAATPAGVKATIRVHVSRLRQVLSPHGVSIIARDDGYLLDLDPASVDASQFRVAVAEALPLRDAADRAVGLRAALALWRGDLLDGASGPEAVRALAGDLLDLRQMAMRRCIEADLDGDRVPEAVAELRGIVARDRTHEGFAAMLMSALHRIGRPAAALEVYADVRRAVAAELGVEPGPQLRDLYAMILQQSGEPGLDPQPAVAPVRALPRDVPAFAGRDAELAALEAAVRAGGQTPVVVVAGPGGVGKTALAVHWGHRSAALFPDGQLFVNLRGYGSRRVPSTTEALTQLLIALGEPLARIPPDLDGCVNMYRARLQGRRILIVLDNAASEDQVDPLLPGQTGCGVVVTSRDPLPKLATSMLVEGGRAGRVRLRQLDIEQSITVLRGVVGAGRIRAEAHDAADLAARCGGLPLALRIAGAQLADRPQTSIASYISEMSSGNVLDTLQVDGDLDRGVRATIASSYDMLSAPARTLFGLLGIPAGADVSLAACTSLLGDPTVPVSNVLAELSRAHLVDHVTGGSDASDDSHGDRYGLHDLVRAYAIELSQAAPDAAVARDRLLGHYLSTAVNCSVVAYPHRIRQTIGPPPPGAVAPEFATPVDAMAWMDSEVANLVAEAERAATEGPPEFAWQACGTLQGYFWIRRNASLWAPANNAASRAVAVAGTPELVALMHNRHGVMHWALADYVAAEEALVATVAAASAAGMPSLEAAALVNLGGITRDLGRLEAARAYCERALAIHLEFMGEGSVGANLVALGKVTGDLGDYEASLGYLRRAEALQRADGDWEYLASTLLAIGETLLDAGAPRAEIDPVVNEAMTIYDESRLFIGQATTLALLGRAALDDGEAAEALALAERAHDAAQKRAEPAVSAETQLLRGRVHAALGDHVAARRDLEAAAATMRRLGMRPGVAVALITLAAIAIAEDDLVGGHAIATEALAMSDRAPEVAAATELLARLGRCGASG